MQIVRETQLRCVAVVAMAAAGTACVSILALLPAFLSATIPLLSENVPTPSEETKMLFEENRKEAAQTRATLAVLAPYAVERPSVQKVIQRIYELLPSGVYIERLQYQMGERGQITITGLSDAREPVNDFRAVLVAEGFFSSVSVPVAALVGALDGRFTMTLSGDF